MEEEECHGWAARDASGFLSPYNFARSTHCGVCYADVVWTRNKLGDSEYPLVPGHEIAGIVKEVGSNVHHFKVGDHVGVGTYVNSCRDCEYCGMDMDVYCSKGSIGTFNSVDVDGTITKGRYSSYIVVHQRYCFRIPNDYPLAAAAPLLCAGITVYSGLGHLAVKFGKAFGLSVTVFSTGITKKDKALNKLGADKFAMVNSLNFIIDTASGDHPFDLYMKLLKTGGTLVLVGVPSEVKLNPISLIMGMKSISGSVTGGTKERQEMLDFCAAQKIYPEIEIIPIEYINEALERLIKGDMKYRFVIDIENSLK
ncbi:putative cinnamyl alcohol dehydrogenase 1 [Camellia lanceoleosa]|uniref:Cinnamyl alcohol dehydrogenase 1 n=1 Tax=Camellia lanceoleosa TaxID=1840588 RepID=A0ACC0HJD8_9ERIC|nr:putative cinnamyl alcohol dehydrogenase 1 [Camellia lanceoleosa]